MLKLERLLILVARLKWSKRNFGVGPVLELLQPLRCNFTGSDTRRAVARRLGVAVMGDRSDLAKSL